MKKQKNKNKNKIDFEFLFPIIFTIISLIVLGIKIYTSGLSFFSTLGYFG